MNKRSAFPIPSRHVFALFAAITSPNLALSQTWSAAGNGSWSTAGNWNPVFVPTTGNTSILGDTATNRTITYDNSASGSLGNLTITQTSAAINALDIQKNLSLSNALTLGASSGGTARVILGSNATTGFTLTSTNGITVNSGGSLIFTSTTNSGNTGVTLAGLSSTTPVTVSGGTLTIQATTGANTGTAVSSIGGNFTMSSGVVALDNSAGGIDRRLALNGASVNITGGSFSGAPRSGAQLQFNNTSAAANITFNPASFGGNITFNFQSDFAQSFTTNQTIAVKMDMRGLGVKTFTSTASGNGVGQIFLWDTNSATPGSAVTLKLGSNLTLGSGLGQPAVNQTGGHTLESGRIDAAIDTNGFTFDLSNGASSGVWTPNATTQTGATSTVWTLGGNGSFRANAFNFAAANVTTNLGTGLVLNAIGGNATASDLASAGAVNAASVFRYSGNAAAANPSTLTFARNIGQVEVTGGGTLRILSGATGTIAGISASNGTVDLGGASRAVGALSLTGGTLANGTYSLTSGDFTGLQTGTVSGNLGGSSTLIKNSAGTLTLSANNSSTFTGKTQVNAGILSIANDNNLGAAPASFTPDQLSLNGGTLTLTSALSLSGNRGITLGASGGTIDVGGTLQPNISVITGSGALTKTGSGFIRSGNNTFSGGFVLNQGWVRPTAFSTVVNGVVTAGPLGTGTLTINGGGITGASGFTPGIFVSQALVNGNFSVSTGAKGTGEWRRVDFAGPVDLRGGQRTVSLGSWANAVTSLASGNSTLSFTSSNNLTTTLGNGTIRFVRENLGGVNDYAALNFDQATFTSGTGLVIGSNVITTMSQANPFGSVAGHQPAVTVESGGYFNTSDAGGARSPQIRSLAGAGVVTSLAGNGTSTLTVNPQSGDSTIFSGQIVDGSTLNVTLGTSAAAVVALSKTGAGTQILSGNNTYSGGTTVSDGTLQLSGGTLGSGGVAVSGGSIDLGGASISNTLGALTGGSISNGTITNNAGTFDVQSGSISAILAGSNGLSKSTAGNVTLSGANTYSGDTTISAGTLALTGSGTFGTGTITGSGGTIDLGGKSITNTVGALTGGAQIINGTFINNSGTYDLQNGTMGTVLAGSNVLTKTGAGTVTLNAANTYTGNTTIAAGTLALGASGSFANSPVINLGTSGSQGVLDLTAKGSAFDFGITQTVSGYGTINIGNGNTVTINGTLAPGNSPGITEVIGNLTMAPTTVTNLEIISRTGAAGTAFDQVSVTGTLTFDGSLFINTDGLAGLVANDSFFLFNAGAYGSAGLDSVSISGTVYNPGPLANALGIWTVNDTANNLTFTFNESTGYLAVTAIPEPSTYAIIAGLGAVGLAFCRRRSLRRAA